MRVPGLASASFAAQKIEADGDQLVGQFPSGAGWMTLADPAQHAAPRLRFLGIGGSSPACTPARADKGRSSGARLDRPARIRATTATSTAGDGSASAVDPLRATIASLRVSAARDTPVDASPGLAAAGSSIVERVAGLGAMTHLPGLKLRRQRILRPTVVEDIRLPSGWRSMRSTIAAHVHVADAAGSATSRVREPEPPLHLERLRVRTIDHRDEESPPAHALELQSSRWPTCSSWANASISSAAPRAARSISSGRRAAGAALPRSSAEESLEACGLQSLPRSREPSSASPDRPVDVEQPLPTCGRRQVAWSSS